MVRRRRMTPRITKARVKKLIDTVNAGLVNGLGQPEPGKMCVEAAVCYALGLPHNDNPPCVSRAIRSLKIALNDSNWSSEKARAQGMLKLAILQLGTHKDFDDTEFVQRVAEMTISKIVPRALRHAASIHDDPKHKEALEQAAIRCEKEKNYDAASAARYAARAARAAHYAASAASDAAHYAAHYAARAARYAVHYAAHYAARAASAARAARYVASYAASYAASDAVHYAASAASAASDKELLTFAQEIEKILIDMKVPGIKHLDLLEAA